MGIQTQGRPEAAPGTTNEADDADYVDDDAEEANGAAVVVGTEGKCFLPLCDADADSEGSDSEGNCDVVDARDSCLLALCDEASRSEPAAAPTPTSGFAEERKKRGLTRGVRCKRNKHSCKPSYLACVGFESVLVTSGSVTRLEDAIDMHIALVQLSQLVRTGMGDG
jgi:hypothetical protein